MQTIIVTDVASGDQLDRVTLDNNGELRYATGIARGMLDGAVRAGLTPEEAFRERSGWSNGYIRTSMPIEPGGELPAIPGLRERVEGGVGSFAARATVASALLAMASADPEA